LQPTFRVRLGEPGNSNALIIAKRLGMPGRLVNQAKGFLANRTRALNEAIAGTLDSRREAEQARKHAREAQLEAEQQRDEFAKTRQKLDQAQKAFDKWTGWIVALQPGDEVFIKSLHRPAKVVRMELHKQRALVSAGGMDIEVPLRDVVVPAEE
ncbi:MAG: hypothetical protein KJ749_11300, partial [Planctomycetes bacterium]|nr:hypothetical protein [Planctomycetota bacterium]